MSRAIWVPAVSARRERPAPCISVPAGRPKASKSAAGEESVAATSVCAMSQSLARSMAPSASVTTSLVPDTKASSAQVGIYSTDGLLYSSTEAELVCIVYKRIVVFHSIEVLYLARWTFV